MTSDPTSEVIRGRKRPVYVRNNFSDSKNFWKWFLHRAETFRICVSCWKTIFGGNLSSLWGRPQQPQYYQYQRSWTKKWPLFCHNSKMKVILVHTSDHRSLDCLLLVAIFKSMTSDIDNTEAAEAGLGGYWGCHQKWSSNNWHISRKFQLCGEITSRNFLRLKNNFLRLQAFCRTGSI